MVSRDRAADRVSVYEIMTKPVLTIHADMLARYAVRLLIGFDLSRAIVLSADRKPVGLATLRDLVLGLGG